MTAKAGERHHKAQLTDAQVRVVRALRERHSWTHQRIGEVFDQPWRSIVNYTAYITRRSAGQPGESDLAEADRIAALYREAVTEATAVLAARLSGVK